MREGKHFCLPSSLANSFFSLNGQVCNLHCFHSFRTLRAKHSVGVKRYPDEATEPGALRFPECRPGSLESWSIVLPVRWKLACCSLTLKSKLEDIHCLFTQSNSGDSPSQSKSQCCDEIWNSFSPQDSDPTEQFTARSTPILSHADQLIWERQSRAFGFKELLAQLLTHRSHHQITAG